MTRFDEKLRALDAAEPLTAAQRDRAAAALDQIVATHLPARPRRFDSGRLSLVAVAAAAVVAGTAIVFPGVLGGGQAYGSWTPVPVALTDAEIALIGPECLDGMDSGPAGGRHDFDEQRARVALAERRGEYAVLLYRIENPETSAACLAHNVPGSDDVDDVKWGIGGSSGPAGKAPAGTYTQGAISDFIEASVTDGAVGPGITGVTIHARDLTVEASVRDGRYVAWWPGPAFDRDADGKPVLDLTYDLTKADGTVVRDARPHLPG